MTVQAFRWHLAASLAMALAAGPAGAQERRPIAGAGAWQLADRLPGVDERTCTARVAGAEVNTLLMLNNQGRPVLTMAWPDWNHNLGQRMVGLSVDGAAPVRLEGGIVGNLVLVLISDDALLGRLRQARRLEWEFPFGRFRADVAGLGTALDAVRACQEGAAAD